MQCGLSTSYRHQDMKFDLTALIIKTTIILVVLGGQVPKFRTNLLPPSSWQQQQQQVLPKRGSLSDKLHGATSQKLLIKISMSTDASMMIKMTKEAPFSSKYVLLHCYQHIF
jgi:hypothetical protein